MNTPRKKIRIGDLLVQNGIISEIQLQQALDKQRQSGLRLGRVLVDLGFVEEFHRLSVSQRRCVSNNAHAGRSRVAA